MPDQFDGHFHSLRDARSFINPVTTATGVASFVPTAHLMPLLREELPFDCLSAFIHEATHHWCFRLPVGTAFALLKWDALAAARRHLERSRGADADATRAFDMACRYDAFVEAQRPLAEGIALFAEFDVRPSSEVTRHFMPLVAVSSLFGPRMRGASDDPIFRGREEQLLAMVLEHVREQTETVERKTNLLVQPLDVERGGYLAGYLTVKTLWQSAMSLNPALGDSELFLWYLVAWVYSDFGLVAHLLDDDLRGVEGGQEVARYYFRRVVAFLETDHRRRLDEFIAVLRRPIIVHEEGWEHETYLGLDRELWERGMRALDRGLEEIPTREVDAYGWGGAAQLVFERNLLYLGSTEAWIEVTDDEIRLRLPNGTARLERIDDRIAAGHAGPGVVEICLDMAMQSIVLAVSVEEEVVVVARQAFGNEALSESVGPYRPYRTRVDAAEDAYTALQQTLLDVSRSGTVTAYAREILEDSILESSDEYYSTLGLMWVDEPRRDDVRARMAERGFAGVLGRVELVRTVARLSLAGDKTPAPPEVRPLVKEISSAASTLTGDPIVHDVDGQFLSRV